ncbi:hypothetical protein CW745_03495 [Psychromonas sp. psych-6C06]|uniref:BatD family protein n=1 Tax=Psychromonas sp. psych-6C06 TaxID=2058089 RepID=UPI000C348107|nr:BatD family protein [Psychromonas sp. psych-6C06]PKF62510.1 hypothetical protein CW745_03495 [Psychromonas sp. psych-6C06]
MNHLLSMNGCRSLILLLAMLITPTTLWAISISDLQQDKLLSIETWLSTETTANRDTENKQGSAQNKILTAAIGEQVVLNIQLGTNRWFTRAPNIPEIEIANVMNRQRQPFSVHSSKRINGETWSFQLWQISLLPQSSGHYELGELALDIEVMSPNDGKVAGTVRTQAQGFKVILPDANLVEENWFSASQVNIKQQWHQSNNKIMVGDSIRRDVTIEASNTLSVLLPNVLQQQENTQFQTYETPAVLQDHEHRGDYLSTRKEQQTYILQQGGEVSFPDIVVTWWDTKNQQLVKQVIQGKTINVTHTLSSWLQHHRRILVFFTIALLFILASILKLRQHLRRHGKPTWWLYFKAVNAQNWSLSLALLYKKIRNNSGQLTLKRGITSSQQQSAKNLQQTISLPDNNHQIAKRCVFSMWFAVRQQHRNVNSAFKIWRHGILPRALPQLKRGLQKRGIDKLKR